LEQEIKDQKKLIDEKFQKELLNLEAKRKEFQSQLE